MQKKGKEGGGGGRRAAKVTYIVSSFSDPPGRKKRKKGGGGKRWATTSLGLRCDERYGKKKRKIREKGGKENPNRDGRFFAGEHVFWKEKRGG